MLIRRKIKGCDPNFPPVVAGSLQDKTMTPVFLYRLLPLALSFPGLLILRVLPFHLALCLLPPSTSPSGPRHGSSCPLFLFARERKRDCVRPPLKKNGGKKLFFYLHRIQLSASFLLSRRSFPTLPDELGYSGPVSLLVFSSALSVLRERLAKFYLIMSSFFFFSSLPKPQMLGLYHIR